MCNTTDYTDELLTLHATHYMSFITEMIVTGAKQNAWN